MFFCASYRLCIILELVYSIVKKLSVPPRDDYNSQSSDIYQTNKALCDKMSLAMCDDVPV